MDLKSPRASGLEIDLEMSEVRCSFIKKEPLHLSAANFGIWTAARFVYPTSIIKDI